MSCVRCPRQSAVGWVVAVCLLPSAVYRLLFTVCSVIQPEQAQYFGAQGDGFDGFAEDGAGAGVDGHGFDVEAGEEDAGDVEELGLDDFEDVDAGAAGHLVVEDGEVQAAAAHDLEGVITAAGFDDLEAGAAEEVSDAGAELEIVVGDQDAAGEVVGGLHGALGRLGEP